MSATDGHERAFKAHDPPAPAINKSIKHHHHRHKGQNYEHTTLFFSLGETRPVSLTSPEKFW